MPLVWAHAEYIKLLHSLLDGRVFDMPAQTVRRYIRSQKASPLAVWRFNNKRQAFQAGKILRVEVPFPAVVRWTADGRGGTTDTPARDSGLGMFAADLPVQTLPPGAVLSFTLRGTEAARGDDRDHTLAVVDAEPAAPQHPGPNARTGGAIIRPGQPDPISQTGKERQA
jgi:glucoamylase